MCGRIIQASPPDLLALKIVNGLEDRDNRVPTGANFPPRYNGAPSQQHWVIRRNPQTGECSLDLLQWGLLPNWCKDPKALKPINAMAETVATKPYFREGYRKRRCIVPVDGFFEWTAVKGSKTKQPYAIAMRDRSPFGIAGVWENWRDPASGEWVGTFAIVTVPANSLVSRIHDRMPAILAPDEFEGWLSEDENPRNLMRPFDPDLMTMWPGDHAGEFPQERRCELGGGDGPDRLRRETAKARLPFACTRSPLSSSPERASLAASSQPS